MAKRANPGDLRTEIVVMERTLTTDKDGFDIEVWLPVFGMDGDGKAIPTRCKWENAHGTDVLAMHQLGMTAPATLTMRYSPLVTPTCHIYKVKDDDPRPFVIVSLDNINDRGRWLELHVQRKEKNL